MARNLNIERRRKLIRHYQAMRRRRSPVRRAFTYWWGTLLLSALTVGALATTVHGWCAEGRVTRAEGAKPLRAPGLQLRLASATQVAELMRLGNARRSAMALSDREVGITLDGALPEPEPLGGKPLAPLVLEVAIAGAQEAQATLLPPAYAGPEAASDARAEKARAFEVTLDTALAEAGFPAPEAPALVEGPGRAVFQVALDGVGRPESVLRLAPAGEESADLRRLRLALSAQRGARGPAEGLVICRWKRIDKESGQ